MKVTLLFSAALATLGLVVGGSSTQGSVSGSRLLFSDVISVCKQRQEKMSQHPFLKMLADQSIPARQRMTFAPYWAFFAMAAADVLDTWIYIPNPQTELEERINMFVEEEGFHYNLFLHDMEQVLGYTPDRFGSFSAVMRHMYGAESTAVRELFYAWIAVMAKYNDPLITLVTYEAHEAYLKDFFETVKTYVYQADEDLKELQYFGPKHVELEMNHRVTSWFKEESPLRPLTELEITPLQQQAALEVVDMLYERYVSQSYVPLMQLHDTYTRF